MSIRFLGVVAKQWKGKLVADKGVDGRYVDPLPQDSLRRCGASLDISIRVEQINLYVRVDGHQFTEFSFNFSNEVKVRCQFGKALGGEVRRQRLIKRLSEHEVVVTVGSFLQEESQTAIRGDQERNENKKL